MPCYRMPEQVSECSEALLVFCLTSLTILTVLQAWQALPIVVPNYGMNSVQGLRSIPSVVKIMQMLEYTLFFNQVLQAECDSVHKLHIVQQVPHLEEWNTQEAKHAREEPQQVHREDSISTISSETREQSHVRSAKAAGINSEAPVAKRPKSEAHVVQTSEQDPEEQPWQAELAQLEAQLRKQAL